MPVSRISNLESEIENLKQVIKAKENKEIFLSRKKTIVWRKLLENLKLRETITGMGKDQEALTDKRAVESRIY